MADSSYHDSAPAAELDPHILSLVDRHAPPSAPRTAVVSCRAGTKPHAA